MYVPKHASKSCILNYIYVNTIKENLSFKKIFYGIKIETLISTFNGFTVMMLTTLPCSFFVTCLGLIVSAVH